MKIIIYKIKLKKFSQIFQTYKKKIIIIYQKKNNYKYNLFI